jgi:hypothetical protein
MVVKIGKGKKIMYLSRKDGLKYIYTDQETVYFLAGPHGWFQAPKVNKTWVGLG